MHCIKILDGLYRRVLISMGNALPQLGVFNDRRSTLYRLAGLNIGQRVTILGPLRLEFSTRAPTAGNISIGAGTYLNAETWFSCRDSEITIGKNVLIGPRVAFETATHCLALAANHVRPRWTKPIVIKDDVWIGAGATILPGVTVHEGAVVAAGALVINDVDPFTLVGGVPAHKIKKIEPSVRIN